MIHVYEPWIAKKQAEYVNAALRANMLSFHGEYEKRFSQALAHYFGRKYCVLTNSGSTALFSLYMSAGLTGKKVITSALTYVATVNQLMLAGAHPFLVDCDSSLQMDLNQVEDALKLGGFAAVVVPQLYADAPDMFELVKLCYRYNVSLIEDSAEGFACEQRGKLLGTFGLASAFSFFSNKILGTGEGGSVITDSPTLYNRVKLFASHNTIAPYTHVGPLSSNYRMTNIQAAIGLAQLEDLPKILDAKNRVFNLYDKLLPGSMLHPKCKSSYWLPVAKLGGYQDFAPISNACYLQGVEVRPVFKAIHKQPEWPLLPSIGSLHNSEEAERLFVCLPGSPNLTNSEIHKVCEVIRPFLRYETVAACPSPGN